MSTPQSVRAREIVRGVDVEEQELRIAEAPDLGQREDTDRDALVEADGAEVAGVEGWRRWRRGSRDRRRRRAARRRGGRALSASIASCASRPAGERPDQRRRDERHVPGDAHDRRRRLDHRRVDPAERARVPGGRRAPPEGPGRQAPASGALATSSGGSPRAVGQRVHQPVQDPLAADRLQPLRPAAEPGGPAARPGPRRGRGRRSVASPAPRSRMTSSPTFRLKMCL